MSDTISQKVQPQAASSSTEQQIDGIANQATVSRQSGLWNEPTLPHASAILPGMPSAPPGFEILGLLGRGGMGVVYKARQQALNRVVALKMILSGDHSSLEERGRFAAEAQSVASLQHPNVVQIFEFGTHENLPYLALEYCDGGSLAANLTAGPLQPRDAAELVATLARGVQAAHDRRVIHRDLKPANILLGADGTPKVADFGLAKNIETSDGPTRTGAILGTPSYLSPEQAAGDAKRVGPGADIYALGAILYACVTGRPPFQAATPFDTVMQVMSEEPPSVQSLQPNVPLDLQTICHHCLQKDSARRYVSAQALAEDLQRFLKSEPVQARPIGRLDRGWRWCRRNPAIAGLAAATFTILLAATAISLVLAGKANAAAQRAEGLLAELEKTNQTRADTAIRVIQFLRQDPSVLALPDTVFEREFSKRFVRANSNLTVADLKRVFLPPVLPTSVSQAPSTEAFAKAPAAGTTGGESFNPNMIGD